MSWFYSKSAPPPSSTLAFSGSHDQQDLGIPTEISSSAITLECWCRTTYPGFPADVIQLLIEKPHTSHTAPYYCYGLAMQGVDASSTGFNFRFGEGSNLRTFNTPNLSLAASTWYHVAATYDGNDVKIYVGGVEVFTQNIVIATIASNGSKPVTVGGHGNVPTVERFNGQIDDVRIWNVVRTQGQIAAAMSTALSSGTGLVASWKFDENTGTTTADATGGVSPATLASGVTFQSATKPY